jgi:putative transposase
MPNHFHFLVRQLKDNGISIFMSQVSNSYTKFFNTKNKRIGALFQGPFKAVHIQSDEQLIHTSRYIHLNPVVSNLTKNIASYRWSSYCEYLDKPYICSTSEILDFFASPVAYKSFIENQINYAKTLEILKHTL